jgi:hypothetical protein
MKVTDLNLHRVRVVLQSAAGFLSAREIGTRAGIKSERVVRAAVKDLLFAGFPIVASPKRGIGLAKGPADLILNAIELEGLASAAADRAQFLRTLSTVMSYRSHLQASHAQLAAPGPAGYGFSS